MTELKIPGEQAITLLTGRLGELAALQGKHEGSPYYNFLGWCSKTWRAIDEIYGPGSMQSEEIRSLGMPACSCRSTADTATAGGQYADLLEKYLDEIRAGETP